jgi:hypothetical protein
VKAIGGTDVNAATCAYSAIWPRQHLSGSVAGDDAVPMPASAGDHEAVHAYSLPGIVMCVRNALLSAGASMGLADVVRFSGR